MTKPKLFSPLTLGALALQHRVVLAPLTRMRAALPGNVPTPLNAEYYAQRSTPGGLLIAEATQVSRQGQGYPGTPGIHTEEQAEGWRLVTDAVHAKGGLIVLQLWHVGRISHSSYQEDGRPPISASDVPAKGRALSANAGPVPYETPRPATVEEIAQIVAQYRRGAELAKQAGFDGVEVHGANGYLIEQFTNDYTNRRTDAYGGSAQNRSRFLREVVDAVVGVWGPERTGIRLSPFGSADSHDSDPVHTYTTVLEALNPLNLSFVHLIEPRSAGAGAGATPTDERSSSEVFRPVYRGKLIAAGGYMRDEAIAVVEKGQADAVAFGRYFISNPDLPRRLEINAELTPYNRPTFYSPGPVGYTDYPFLETAAA
ncbi:alkene reductase [Zavarzinia sp. CC-PAN008]|uniref:alkene reductase n=1 Tax=Zavarzinia sp. CC-PAN008 TaxID=3243332 RepID=UPI003F744189